MSYGYKISAGVVGSVLVAALAFLMTYTSVAEASEVFRRMMWGLAVAATVVVVAVAVYGLAYLGTARQRAEAQQRLDSGRTGYAPDRLDMRPVKPSKFWYNMALIFVGVLFVGSAAGTGMSLSALLEMPARMWDYTVQMIAGVAQIPDEEARGDWSNAFDAMLESVAIAWIGTIVGALFSLPCGILAARNMTPLAIYLPMRFILSVIRAVPEIVFAVAIFIPLLGVGPAQMGGAMAGAFALGISSIGTLSKLISEAIEGVDPGPLEASRASGATHTQMIRWAVLPQVLPEVLAIWLYRFEVNIRASAILGALGAGGIGRLISPPNGLFGQRPYDWEAIGITLFVIIAITIVVDQISGFVRHRVIHGKTVKQKKRRKDDSDPKVAAVPV
ncbi:phosphonate ABC transporter, permease protein PhnE [Nesterenkonia ebinurensis]|uniref:phosphonate ABC transporter, permease protein PhnE n=1 Tax=Nesterenkonia ebinurensis TaxID=2608252 RepID=UPI001CC6141F|nr:phosphonate ABC transporter, permease protein PhnE [Nesterenkonia ebinurensis]